MKKIAYLTGLPRSGSTLFCNLLSSHPEISSTPSSPLCELIQGMRRQWSDDSFLLSQLDSDFDNVYQRLRRSMVAFMEAWSNTDKTITVDKNRGWLHLIETIRDLFPDFKMIVCLRDLRDVYSSIEKQHRKTLLLEYPDHMEHNIIDIRASTLFADNGVVGGPIKALYNIADVPDIVDHLFFLRYEDFIKEPQKTMDTVFNFLEVSAHKINFDNIEQTTKESDSYYRFKYPHTIKNKFTVPEKQPISPRILETIPTRFDWFYKTYYPELFIQEARKRTANPENKSTSLTPLEESIAKDIEKEIG